MKYSNFIIRLVILFILAAFLKVGPVMAQSGQVSDIAAHVCNDSGDELEVAVFGVDFKSNVLTGSGWYKIEDNSCGDIGSFVAGEFYYFARNQYSIWSGDFPLCVNDGVFSETGVDAKCRHGFYNQKFVRSTITAQDNKFTFRGAINSRGGILPTSNVGAFSEVNLAYDQCATYWNQKEWANLDGARALVAATKPQGEGRFSATCFWAKSSTTGASAMNSAITNCRNSEFVNCYPFARNATIYGWARRESDAVASRHAPRASGGGGNLFGQIVGGVAIGMGIARGNTDLVQQGVATASGQEISPPTSFGGINGGGGNSSQVDCPGILASANESKRRSGLSGTVGGRGYDPYQMEQYKNYMKLYDAYCR